MSTEDFLPYNMAWIYPPAQPATEHVIITDDVLKLSVKEGVPLSIGS